MLFDLKHGMLGQVFVDFGNDPLSSHRSGMQTADQPGFAAGRPRRVPSRCAHAPALPARANRYLHEIKTWSTAPSVVFSNIDRA
jgi:hypothetical protein